MSTVYAEGTAALSIEGIGRRAATLGEPAFLTERRQKALAHYLAAPMPGRRDEIWRRVEFGDLNLDAAVASTNGASAGTLSALSNEARARQVFFATPEVALKERSALLEKYWNTEVFPAGVEDKYGS